MNITRRDVLELRRRMTKKGCTFTRLCGCYVDGNKNVVLKFSEAFSDLEEDTFYKYLEIAKKAMSGSLGNNLLELRFQRGETADERQRSLYALKASGLKEPEMLDRLYQLIIENYSCSGNYLILAFHDKYDVIARTSDRRKLDESSEIYEYMIVAICPVDFSKPGLSYREEEHRIGVSDRFWMVGAPEIAFTYPAFIDHGGDSNAVMYYVKTGKDSRQEFIQDVLLCGAQRTAGEEKTAFKEVIQDAFEDPQQGESVFLKVQKQLSDMTRPDPDQEDDDPSIALTGPVMREVMAQVDMPEEAREIIQEAFEDRFGELPPQSRNVVDEKLVPGDRSEGGAGGPVQRAFRGPDGSSGGPGGKSLAGGRGGYRHLPAGDAPEGKKNPRPDDQRREIPGGAPGERGLHPDQRRGHGVLKKTRPVPTDRAGSVFRVRA